MKMLPEIDPEKSFAEGNIPIIIHFNAKKEQWNK